MKKIFLMMMGLLVAANAFAATPADPTDVVWSDCGNESGYSYLRFTLPTVDVNGNPLDIEMMGYRIYTDNDQLFTFNSAVYSNVWGSTTDIYYYNWEAGTDIQSNIVYFYRTNADGFDRFFETRIGVQVFYLNDNFAIGGVSNIVYANLDNPVAELPKPGRPELTEFIDYGLPTGINVGFDFPHTIMTQELVDDQYTIDKEFDMDSPDYGNYTILDPEKVSFSIFTDNDQVFTFTPEMFPQIEESMTRFPYNSRTPSGYVGMSDIHINGLTTLVDEPFFTWRIGIQSYYTDNGQTSASDMYYMEIYPQLQEAKNVTSTSFLADWSCDDPNTYTINNFIGDDEPDCGYNLYIIDVANNDTTVIYKVNPTNWTQDEWGYDIPLAGATYQVDGLTPGATYQFYVVVKQNASAGQSFSSVVREVTLPGGQTHLRGDVNHDHDVTIADVSALIDYLLDDTASDACPICADCNLDEDVTIADVSALIDFLLYDTW